MLDHIVDASKDQLLRMPEGVQVEAIRVGNVELAMMAYFHDRPRERRIAALNEPGLLVVHGQYKVGGLHHPISQILRPMAADIDVVRSHEAYRKWVRRQSCHGGYACRDHHFPRLGLFEKSFRHRTAAYIAQANNQNFIDLLQIRHGFGNGLVFA